MNSILQFPDKNLLHVIRNELGEDPDRLKTQIKEFKEWLRSEPHLPKVTDENVIQAFIRSCEYNLEKSKQRFEQFLFARHKLKNYYTGCNFNEDFFNKALVNRHLILCPDLTPQGYRILMYCLPTDVNDFVFADIAHYFLFLLDYLYFEDTASGIIMLSDFKSLTVQHIAKINIANCLKVIDFACNISPLRIKAIHFLHLPGVTEIFINMLISTMNEKIQKRVQTHQHIDLTKVLPKHIVPKDYGGTGMSFIEHGDAVLRYLKENPDWVVKTKNLKLADVIPPHKKDLYSLDEFTMNGGIKELAID